MAISSPANKAALFCFSFVAFSCSSANGCEFFESHIQIAEWKSPLPKTVELQIYSANNTHSNSKSTESIRYSATITPAIPAYGWGPTLSLKQAGETVRRLRVDESYTLVIDDIPTYRISEIESKRVDLGCPVTAFKVNECIGKQGRYLRFDASCR